LCILEDELMQPICVLGVRRTFPFAQFPLFSVILSFPFLLAFGLTNVSQSVKAYIGCHGYGETRMSALHWHKLCSAIIVLCDERRACDLSKVNLVAMNLKTDYLHASKKAK